MLRQKVRRGGIGGKIGRGVLCQFRVWQQIGCLSQAAEPGAQGGGTAHRVPVRPDVGEDQNMVQGPQQRCGLRYSQRLHDSVSSWVSRAWSARSTCRSISRMWAPWLNGVIRDELELRRVAQLQSVPQLPPQEARSGLETLEDLLFLGFIQDGDIDPGIAQISGGVHPGDGDHADLGDPGIFQPAELVAELPLDFFVDAADAIACHSRPPLVRRSRRRGFAPTRRGDNTGFAGGNAPPIFCSLLPKRKRAVHGPKEKNASRWDRFGRSPKSLCPRRGSRVGLELPDTPCADFRLRWYKR